MRDILQHFYSSPLSYEASFYYIFANTSFSGSLYNAEMPLNRHAIWNCVLFDLYWKALTGLYQQQENSIPFVSMKSATTLALQVTSEGRPWVCYRDGSKVFCYGREPNTCSTYPRSGARFSFVPHSCTYPGHPGSLSRLHSISPTIYSDGCHFRSSLKQFRLVWFIFSILHPSTFLSILSETD
jgi:hypothetical protein